MKRLLVTFVACLIGAAFALFAFNLNDRLLWAPLRELASLSLFYIGFRAIFRVLSRTSQTGSGL
jgi:hypothetical protein